MKIKWPIDGFDILIFAGAASFLLGVWRIYQPAAFILGGLGCMYLGLIGVKPKGKE